MIKAIIFDWGGVLIDNPENGLIDYCANFLGIKTGELKDVYSKYEPEFQKGLISEGDMWKKFAAN